MVGARSIAAACAGLLSFVAIAAPAQAQSVVFVKSDGNVWIANPTGSGQQRVTSDGTSANPYYAPTQSASGTIVVARGTRANAQLFRLSSSGARLNAPFTVPRPALVDPVISPDGSKIAMWTLSGGEPCNTNMYCFEVTSADRYNLLTTPAWMTFQHPAWLGNSRLMLFNGTGQVSYADLSSTGYRTWFSWLDYYKASSDGFGQWIEGAASADGTRLAIVTHVENRSSFVIKFFSGTTDVRSGELTSYRPTLSTCSVTPPDGTNGSDPQHADLPAFGSLSFSPSGDAIAFGYKGAVYGSTFGDCAVHKLISSASDPSWGAANVPPAPTLSVVPARTNIAGLIRGMKVKVTLSISGTVTLKLTKGRQTIASTRVTLTARKAKTVVVKPSSKVSKTLKSVKKLKATLTATVVARSQPVIVKQLTIAR